MNKTFKRMTINGRDIQLLTLPGTNLYKFEIINMYGANIEREIEKSLGLNVYGLSHFVEHLGFRATRDYSTETLMDLLKTEGDYNASTDHDRINYWFKSTMAHVDITTQLVCNYALNNLRNIPADEFEIEKKVVYNEAKRYADDDQVMFSFNTVNTLCGYHEEDNVIGIPQTVETFTLEDAIMLKDVFLANGHQIYNITYDPTLMSEEEILTRVTDQLDRWALPAQTYDHVMIDEGYNDLLRHPVLGSKYLENESEQAMTALLIDNVDHIWTAGTANQYLSRYATGTSLDDVIREQNGLTYGVDYYENIVAYKPFTVFSCDVTRGTEDLLMELLASSINTSVDAYDEEAHAKLLKTRGLKRVMRNVNQERYDTMFWVGAWYPYMIEDNANAFADDIDAATLEIEAQHAQYEMIKNQLEKTRKMVNDKEWSLVSNVKSA